LLLVEAKARDIHVPRLPRYFQQLQDPHVLPDMIGTDSARLARAVNLFKPLRNRKT
jgi:hypothetical protein